MVIFLSFNKYSLCFNSSCAEWAKTKMAVLCFAKTFMYDDTGVKLGHFPL
mgnify:CR=1 FL=1